MYHDGNVYVVIDSAGGIGAVFSEHLIATRSAQMIWLGQRQEDEKIQNLRARLSQLGPEPLYLQTDATDRTALQRAYEQIKQRHGKIHNVIHSAVEVFDESIANISESRFTEMLS